MVSDDHLLGLSRQGDENAFVTLFHRHQAPIYRFLLHMCGSREMAEEVTQEVFLALLSKQVNYSSTSGDLQGFLIGTARNQLRKQFRRMGKLSSWANVPEIGTSPEFAEAISKEQEAAALRLAILRLPPRYREVIVMCEIDGMDVTRASEQLGCAVGTVKSRLNRARAILRSRLRDRQGCPA